MFEYFKFLFRSFKPLNEKLKNISFLQGKVWVRISVGFNEKWFFRKGGILTVSINGNIIDGKYEFLNEYLILRYSDKNILLNQSLIYKDILLLKKDSDDSFFLAFYDNSKYTQEEFLRHFENSRRRDLNIREITLLDNSKAEIIREPDQKHIVKGDAVLINGELSDDNYLETENNLYELDDGKISKIYYKRKYELYNNVITVKQNWQKLSIGDSVISMSNNLKDGLYKISQSKGIEIKGKMINQTFDISNIVTLIKRRKIEIWQKYSYSYSVGDLVIEDNQKVDSDIFWVGGIHFIKVKNGRIY